MSKLRTIAVAAGFAATAPVLPGCSAGLEPGESRLTVDGRQIPVGVAATCTERPDGLFLVLAEEHPDPARPDEVQGFELLLNKERDELRRVLIVIPGITMGHGTGDPQGDSSVRRDDNRYTVTGHGLDVAASDAPGGGALRAFEVEVRCP